MSWLFSGFFWLNLLKQNNEHNHTQTSSRSHLQNIEGKFYVNAGTLITYDFPFGKVKKLYGAQQWSSNKKSKFKKHHVAYETAHANTLHLL